jgi:hypothetical protein
MDLNEALFLCYCILSVRLGCDTQINMGIAEIEFILQNKVALKFNYLL